MASTTQRLLNGRPKYQTSEGVAFKFRAPPRPPGAPGASKHDTGKDYTELLSLTPPEFPVPYVNGIKIETAFDMLCERESPQTHPPLHRWTNLTPNQRPRHLLQAFFGCLVSFSTIILLFVFWKDVRQEAVSQSLDMKFEASLCEEEYKRNQCDSLNIPEMLELCRDWRLCMATESLTVLKSKVIAQVFGDVLEHFFIRLSLKTLGVVIFIVYLGFSAVMAIIRSR